MRFLMAVVAVAVLSGAAHAGPFRRSVTTTRASTCVGGSCSTASTRTVTSGAQGHAEAMASRGVLVHASSHGSTYEGIGVGSSPEAALRSCCNNGGTILEEGTAYGHGRWYAVRRYSQR
jgi:hypothetical protein